jgi:hypothetical protein
MTSPRPDLVLKNSRTSKALATSRHDISKHYRKEKTPTSENHLRNNMFVNDVVQGSSPAWSYVYCVEV